ncbi:MAG: hypothetical protein HZB56_13205 [Deltaproteobacteria bacterium]|nr:hypothetical protein [Deltaproteobacteria bacterium]
MTALLILVTLGAEPSMAAVAGEKAVYLWWGTSTAVAHEVHRAEAGGAFQRLARIEPVRDRARAEEILLAPDDPLVRMIRWSDDFQARASFQPELDRDLSLASPVWARLRGAGFLDESAAAGRSYRYRVVRVGESGAESALGEVEIVAGKLAPLPAPDPVPSLATETPSLAWEAAAGVGYEVRRSDAPGGPFEPAGGGLVTPSLSARRVSWQDRGASPDGRTLYYQLAARDLLGRIGKPSMPVPVATLDRTPPEPPRRLRTEGIPGGIRLAWERSPEPDAAGYHLYRSELAPAEGKDAMQPKARVRLTRALLPRDAASFDDRETTPRKVYHYEITAADRKGNESRASPPARASPRDQTPPAKVQGLRATAGEGGRVRLAWRASAESDLWTYRVLAGSGERGPLRLLEQVAPRSGEKEMTHELRLDPRSQEARRFAVAAVDLSENQGPPSEPVEIRLPDRVPPSAPILTRLAAADGAVEIGWASGGEPDLAGHHVWRAERGQAALRLTERPLPPEARDHRDATARAGVAYLYAVSAVDRSGNEGPRSEVRSTATFRAGRPQAPAGLVARAAKGTDRVLLEWKLPEEARGTMVWSAAAREGAWQQLGGLVRQSRIEVARPAQGSVLYRVQAIDGNGEPSEPSEPVEIRANGERVRP